MNDKFFLSKKRSRKDPKTERGSSSNEHSAPEMVEFNGFNIIELFYAESLEVENSLKDNNFHENHIIEINEKNSTNHETSQNNTGIVEMSRMKAKNIEDYYTSKFGLTTIKENCFKCLMTDFLSNELLYFNSRKDLFNYIKYCFANKNKLLFTNEDIYKQNKANFFSVNSSFINGWRFFIPKTICKGCFMDVINMKYLISYIKNIFSDTERDSLCRTNYRNYALFSPRFRAAFSLRSRSRNSRRSRSINRNNNFRNRKKSENNSDKKNSKNEKIYNLAVRYDERKRSLIIEKKVLDQSVIELLNRNKLFAQKNKNTKKDTNSKNNEIKESNEITNCIELQDKKNINTNDKLNLEIQFNVNFDLIANKTREVINEMNHNYYSFFSQLEKVKLEIETIEAYINYTKQKIYQLFMYPQLFSFTDIKTFYATLFISFEVDRNNLNKNLLNAKNSTIKSINLLNCVLNEIKKNTNGNLKEKQSLVNEIKEFLFMANQNKEALEKYDHPFNNFITWYTKLIKLVTEILSSSYC
jgi:hypothetical protein